MTDDNEPRELPVLQLDYFDTWGPDGAYTSHRLDYDRPVFRVHAFRDHAWWLLPTICVTRHKFFTVDISWLCWGVAFGYEPRRVPVDEGDA